MPVIVRSDESTDGAGFGLLDAGAGAAPAGFAGVGVLVAGFTALLWALESGVSVFLVNILSCLYVSHWVNCNAILMDFIVKMHTG